MHAFPDGAPCWADAALPDLDAGKRFYGELFGWTFADGEEKFGFYTQALQGDQAAAALAPKPDERMPTAWTVYFASSDAAATADRVRAAGGDVAFEPMAVEELGTMMVAADPSGGVFGVWQPGSHTGFSLVDEPGAYCWTELYTRGKDTADPFYRAVFGFVDEPVREADGGEPDFDFNVWSLPGDPDKAVAGRFQMGSGFPAEVPAHFLVYFSVADCDESAATVRSLGGRVTMEPRSTPFGRFAVVADDQGAAFAIIDLTTTEGEMPS